MSVKISQLPSLNAASLVTASNAVVPLVANVTSENVTYQTTIANVKTYVETGNLNVTGAVIANLTSSFDNLVIRGNLNVQGTTTTTSSQNLSTNSSIIDLHTFSSNLAPWTSDDGRDIGLRFFYYKASGGANSAALVWENTTQYLTYYGSGAGNSNAGTISGTLGTLQLGQILIANNTPTTANATGALQVSGGISTGGNIYSGGSVYAAGNVSSSGVGYFSNIQSNGTATVSSTLTAGGLATVNALTSNSYATIHTTLVTGANTTVQGLVVNSSATVGSTLGVTGNINGSGVTLSGSLRATGPGDFDGGLQSTPIGNASASTGRFTTLTTTSNLTANGLTVNNSATIGGALGVTGAIAGSSATFTTVNTGNVIPTAANVYTLGSSANWYSTVYATAVQSWYADLAEKYLADADYEPGTVVVFGGDKEITTTKIYADTRVAGVISTDPAYLMNTGSEGLPVALRGKVPVKVIGPVRKGDLLVTSVEAGYAVSVGYTKDYNPNAVVAKSLVEDKSYDPRVIMAVIV